jgi:hypothetical protein
MFEIVMGIDDFLIQLVKYCSYTLDAGSGVTVYTKKGTNSATELYWGSSGPFWNNDGDKAYLYDNNGKLISTLER